MANLKFSGFTAAAAIDQTDSFLVGFDTDGGGANPTNNKWTFSEVAVGLAAVTATPYSIYAADGAIGTTRKALITDTIQFRNAGDTSDVFTLNTDGTFSLGLGATTTIASQVAIGKNANAASSFDIAIGENSDANGGKSIAIGNYATSYNLGIAIGFNNAAGTGGLAMGHQARSYQSSQAAEVYGVAIGYNSDCTTQGVAIGYNTQIPTVANAIAIGTNSSSTGANSITLNSNGGVAAPSTANAFGVYMSSNTTPDLEVVGGGESTLNTSLKITGQGYTELYANATNLVVDWNESNVQTVTISTSVPVFAPTNPRAGATYILTITQGATPVTVDWNSLVKWPGGTIPTLSAVTGKIDVITLICYDDSTTNGLYYGSATLDLA